MDEKREVLGDPKRGLRTFICCFAMLGLWMRISRNSEPPTSLASCKGLCGRCMSAFRCWTLSQPSFLLG